MAWKSTENAETAWIDYKFVNPESKKIEQKRAWVHRVGDYVVQAGDSLGAIAAKFNSTEEEIKKANPTIDEAGNIFIGQLLVIPVNIVTPTATRPPTSTPITPGPGTILPTATFTPINGGPAATP